MDLSKFKRVSSDDQLTKLMHPAGHEISIAHKALNPKMREQLMKLPIAMAEGGTVEKKSDQPIINVNLGPEIAGALQPNLQATAGDFASLPNANLKDPYQEKVEMYKKQFPAEVATGAINPEERALLDVEAGNAAKLQAAEQEKLAIAGASKKTMEMAQRKQAAGVALSPEEQQVLNTPAQVDPRMSAYEAALAEINKPDQQVKPQASALQTGLGQYESGLKQEAAANTQLAQKQADIMAQEQEQYQKKQQIFEQKFTELQQDSESLRNDIMSGKIDANRYLNQMSGGQKVMTAIGLFLGGMGSGLLGKANNPAMDYLNAQIDRDIKSQEADLGKKQNLLSRNLQEAGTLKEAMEMTRVQYKDILATKLEMEAAKMKNPILQGQVMQAVGKMRIENADKMQSIASQFAANSPLGIINRLPKEMKDNALKEYGEIKSVEGAIKRVDSVMDKMAKLQSTSSRVLSPIQSSNQLEAGEAELFPIVKQIVGERMTDADARILIQPYLIKFTDSEDTKKSKKQGLKNALKASLSGKAPILNDLGIASDQSKYNFTPRK